MSTLSVPDCLIGLAANFALIYVSYLLVARKICSRAAILKATAIVAVVCLLVTIASHILRIIPIGTDIVIALLLTYQCGRLILKLTRKQAFNATLISVGITLALGIPSLLFLIWFASTVN